MLYFCLAVKAITCETTVAQLCPYQKPAKHCPRYEPDCMFDCMSVSLITQGPQLHVNSPIFNCSLFRLYCPRNCLEENPHISRVIGTTIYSDVSPSFLKPFHHSGHHRTESAILRCYLSSCIAPAEVQYMPGSGPCWSHQERCGWLHRCDASGQAETLHCLISKWHCLWEV